MRYLLITYLKKADGKIDEQVTVTKNIKPRDIQTCNIILDFKQRKVEKALIDGLPMGDLDWGKFYTYFHNLYPNIIERLDAEAGFVPDDAVDETPPETQP